MRTCKRIKYACRTASRGKSLHWSYFYQSRLPSTPRMTQRDQPDRESVHGSRRTLLQVVKRHMAVHHCPVTKSCIPPPWGSELVYAPRLCRLLHHCGNLLREDARGRVLPIDFPIRLCALACLGDEDTKIGTHARVYDSNVGTYDCNFLEHRVIN